MTVGAVSRTGSASESLSLARLGGVVGAKLLTMLLGAIVQLFVARAPGPRQFGLCTTVLALATPLAAVSTLGFQQTVLRFGARSVACGDRRALERIAKRAATVAVLVGSFVAAAFVLLAPRDAAPDASLLWFLGGLLVPLGALSLLLGSLLRVLERPLAAMLPEPLLRAATMTFVLTAGVIFPFAPSAEDVLLASVTALVLTVLWSSRAAVGGLATVEDRSATTVQNHEFIRATTYAFVLLTANALATRSVAAVLACVLAPEEFGPYALALRFADLLAVPCWGVTLIAAPRFASLQVAGRREANAELLGRSRLVTTAFSVGPVLITTVFAERLLGLFGPSYTVATTVLQLFALKVLVLAAIGPTLAALTMLGGERTAALWMTLFGALGVGACGLAAARWGAVGGAVAQSLVEVAVAVACGRAVSRHAKHQIPQEGTPAPMRQAG
jgi:O-antigen/teichoic acid export membrane protein